MGPYVTYFRRVHRITGYVGSTILYSTYPYAAPQYLLSSLVLRIATQGYRILIPTDTRYHRYTV